MLQQSITQMRSSAPTLPNFFLVGAPKAGTTSLYHYLDQHPDVYMSPVKEPNYFATEIRSRNIGPQWQQLFRNVNGEKAIGEASVCYLWSNTAARNIASAVPDAKILMMLRNPVDRAFSQYKQAVAGGLVGRSFREQIQVSLHNRSHQFEVLNPFLEYGLYYEQVKRYIELFPAQQILVCLYDEYEQAPEKLLADIFRFLKVDPLFFPDITQRHLQTHVLRFVWLTYHLRKCGLWSRFRRSTPAALLPVIRRWVSQTGQTLKINSADRDYLNDYYREDVARLSTLLRRDLQSWSS